MNMVTPWLKESQYISPLSPACKMCARGTKMVVLITGICNAKCFYCPLSQHKLGKDRIFANEWELDNEDDTDKLIKEAEYIEANGAGITGGDPLIVWERTERYITFLKENFGSDFHVHLYTCGIDNSDHISDLVSAGLDEIRFHPIPRFWNNMIVSPSYPSIKKALETDVSVAMEIPSIPGMDKEIFSLVRWANDVGIKWVNLNELEFSETNANDLIKKGFTVKDDISAAVKGSLETAYMVIYNVLIEDYDIGVHYCSSSFKDGIQLKNRIRRRASNIAKDFDIITDEGTLLKGVIYSNKMQLNELNDFLKSEFKIKEKIIYINEEKNRLEIPIIILEKIAPKLKQQGLDCYIVEEYPTADALEVERTPLPLE
jgi:pyruvate formate-lyase activating enzyme-like uncharacterized protein